VPESVDLPAPAAGITAPVLLLLGTASPDWAGDITRDLAAVLAAATAELPGFGHEAVRYRARPGRRPVLPAAAEIPGIWD
jgi:hypothetical protein